MAERDEYLDSLRRLQAEFENYKKRVLQAAGRPGGPGRRVPGGQAAAGARRAGPGHRPRRRRRLRRGQGPGRGLGLLPGGPGQGGPRADRPGGRAVRPHRPRGGRHQVPRPRRRRAGTAVGRAPVVAQVMRAGYRWHGTVVRPAMVMVQGYRRPGDDAETRRTQSADREETRWRRNANGSRRTTTRPSGCRRRPPPRRSPAPTGSWPRSTTRTPIPGTTRTFKEISAAYDVLGDADKRKEYDEVRTLGPAGRRLPRRLRRVAAVPGGGTFRVEDVGDLGDLFGGLFGGGRRRRPAAGPQRGADVETELHLTFEDAVRGVTTSVNVTTDARCHTCSGSGSAPGTRPDTCPRCGGTGRSRTTRVCSPSARSARSAAGGAPSSPTPAPPARGPGSSTATARSRSGMPAGVEDGQRIRVKGRGAAGRGGGPAGDLYVVARVGPPQPVRSQGANLTLTVPVGFAEAALGHDADGAHPGGTGDPAGPAGTPSGRTFRVKGRGVPGGRKPPPATCWSPSRWPCRTS